MRKGDATPILRGAKTMLFLLAVVGASTLFVIQDSRPTAAESLLHNVVCTVGGLINRECKTAPVEPAPPAPANPAPQPAPEPAPAETPTQSAQPVAHTIQPLAVNAELMAELPNVPLVPSLGSDFPNAMTKFPAHTLQPFANATSGDVLGSSIPTIQATEEGWKLWGIQWYWWLLTISAIITTAVLARSNRLRTLKHLVK